MNAESLSVPVISTDDSTLGAALAYAEAGWFVIPTLRGTKNPGSVVGTSWPTLSSRDPRTIAAWFAGTDYGIALHIGKSGAVAFDVDNPDEMPEALRAVLETSRPPCQSTRKDIPGRGHYIFKQPPGRSIGNGKGGLGGGWGEVRGLNGVLVVAPSIHEDAANGGCYEWFSAGPVPVLPESLAGLLRDGSDAQGAASVAETQRLLAEWTGNSRPELLEVWVGLYRRRVREGDSRHDSMVAVATGAMKEAKAGCFPARLAAATLEAEFLTAATREPLADSRQGKRRTDVEAVAEWRGILSWAVGQASASDVESTLCRVDQHVPDLTRWVEEASGAHAATASPLEPEELWGARPHLRTIHDFAQSRRACPWAVLGIELVRILSLVPPSVVLPAIVGGQASLNLFVAIVGPSGAGKGAAEAAAADAVILESDVTGVGVGSGEGIAHLYMRKPGRGKPPVQYRDAALLSVPEVDTLTGLAERKGATLLPELRKAWVAEPLGFAYADPNKRLNLKRHSYRLGLVVGVQPNRAGGLLDDADGGTPQRFVWLPATDPTAPDVRPDEPESYLWQLPPLPVEETSTGRRSMEVCQEARDYLDAARLESLRGQKTGLEGHAPLARLKVAAALALLDQRTQVTVEDWQLAELVAARSTRTREGVVRELKESLSEVNTKRAQAEGVRAVITDEVRQDASMRRVGANLRRKLRRHGAWVTRKDLRKSLTSGDRENFDGVIEAMVASGEVQVDETGRGKRFRLMGEPG